MFSLVILWFYFTNTLETDSCLFPLFRCLLLFILYLWMFAWNVQVWDKNFINYKALFRFNHHYSTPNQIIRRAIFFTSIYLIIYIIYAFYSISDAKCDTYCDNLPLIVWSCIFLYLFWPSFNYFNGQGRKYFFSLMKEILVSPCSKVDFVIAWATD